MMLITLSRLLSPAAIRFAFATLFSIVFRALADTLLPFYRLRHYDADVIVRCLFTALMMPLRYVSRRLCLIDAMLPWFFFF